ncbi:MAG: phosphatase PAP2 family protein [Acidimicrobiales bacterium]
MDAVQVREMLRRRLRSGRRWIRVDAIRLVLTLVVLSVGWAVARSGVPDWERRLFRSVNGTSDVWSRPLWVIMQLGNIAVAAASGLIVDALLRSWRVCLVAVLTPTVAWYAALPVKEWVGRLRPGDLGLTVVQRGGRIQGLGFLSGHATVAWALATMLAPHLVPRLRPVVYVLAAFVGVARIYVGAHRPLDVIGGAGLGILVGEIGWRVEVLTRRSELPELRASTGIAPRR